MAHLHIRSSLKHLHISLVEGREMTHQFPLHTHHSLIIGMVTAGTRRMVYANDNLVIRRGQIFIVHPGELHACCPDDMQAVDYRVLCIPTALLQTLYPCGLVFPHLLSDTRAAETLKGCFKQLDDTSDEAVQEQILIRFIQNFIPHWATAAQLPNLPPAVSQAQQYLDDHTNEKVDIRMLGRAASLSPYHLNRLFRRQLGLPPHAYQLQAKIQRAQSLLSQGLSPVKTALELGFSDQSHFSHFFKKYVGVPPSHYQRQNHEDAQK